MMRYVTAAVVTGLAAGLAAGPAAAQQLELGGEIRPRFEVRDPVPGPLGETREFTSMRTRLSLSAGVLEDVRAFVQLQDVRVWGSEAGTTDAAADMLDLHQGWIEVGDGAAGPWSLRVGRQELAYGGQRLVGVVNWAQQARSFDGVRLRVRPAEGIRVDGFATQIGDVDGGRADESLLGVYGVLDAAGRVDLYVLYHDRDRVVGSSGPGGLRTAELSKTVTAGGRWAATRSAVDWRLEAAYQTGERMPGGRVMGPRDVAAYLLAARVGTDLADAVAVSLWYDYLSGDDDANDREFRVFDTLFATNHKFYGFMDLFLDIPAHTAGRGLQDLALKTTYRLAPSHSLSADLHSFRFAAADGLGSGHIGEELDLTYRWGYGPGVSVTAGASYFRAGDGPAVPRGPSEEDQMVWGYLMMDVVF